jgi:hypothetical protein
VTSLVSQVQKETETQLLAVKKQIIGISTDFTSKLEQASTDTQLVVNELADQMAEHRSEVDSNFARLEQEVGNEVTRQQERVKEIAKASTQEKSAVDRKFDKLQEKLLALEDKICGLPGRQNSAADVPEIGHDTTSPTDVRMNEASTSKKGTTGYNGASGGNGSFSCQSNHCHIPSQNGVSDCSVHGHTEIVAVSSFLSNSELPLP